MENWPEMQPEAKRPATSAIEGCQAGPSLRSLDIIDQLLRYVGASERAEEVLQHAVTIARGHTGAAWGMAYLQDGRSEGPSLTIVQGDGEVTAGMQAMVGGSHPAEGKRWAFAYCRAGDDDASQPCCPRTGLAAWLVVPLVANEADMGVLVLGWDAEPPESVDAGLWGVVGKIVGLGVENARLYQEMQNRLRQSSALYEVSKALSSTLNLDDLLSLIVRLATDNIPKAGDGVLHLMDERSGRLHPRAHTWSVEDSRPDYRGRTDMRSGKGIAGTALEMGEVVNVPDVSLDERYIKGGTRAVASMLVAPLRLGDRSIGTLSVDSTQRNAFTQQDEYLLMTLATQAAVAIDNARLVQDLQQSLDDLESAQEALVQSEKLSAIGQLIAGVAHELNNPLTAVMGYAQLLQASSADEQMRHDLDRISIQAQRAAKIVQNLLTFARQHKADRQRVAINDIVERVIDLRAYQLQVDNVRVVLDLDEDPLETVADGNQLQQVMLNLLNNAHDAIRSVRDKGEIRISTRHKGHTILISCADDGPGLAPEVRRHLFEPFYTTKDVGQGTGLGLSICYGIISEHRGKIWAESTEGGGTVFHVELPVVQEPVGVGRQASAEMVAPSPGRRVLVVEDERDVAQLLRRVLVADGHTVILAEDGNEAVEHLQALGEDGLDLVISDIKMPGLGGPALYKRLKRDYPSLVKRMVIITGDMMNAATRGFLRETGLPYLTKPFGLDDLKFKMTELLRE